MSVTGSGPDRSAEAYRVTDMADRLPPRGPHRARRHQPDRVRPRRVLGRRSPPARRRPPDPPFDASALPVPHRRRDPRLRPPSSSSRRRTARSLNAMARTVQLGVVRRPARHARRRAREGQARPDALRRRVRARSWAPPSSTTRRRRASARLRPTAPARPGEVGARRAAAKSRRCGCSSTCRTCWPATSSILHDAQGPNNTHHRERRRPACWPSARRCRILRRDAADFLLVGGSESKINPLSMIRSASSRRCSQRNDDPEGRSGRSTATATAVLGEGGGGLRAGGARARPEARARRSTARWSASARRSTRPTVTGAGAA